MTENAYRDYLSETGRDLVSKIEVLLKELNTSRIDEYLALIPRSKKGIYSDGIRAIYEPSFEEPLISALLAYGKKGLETLYRIITDDRHKFWRLHAIRSLYFVGWHHPDSFTIDIEFLQRFMDHQVIDSVRLKVEAIYRSAEATTLARELIARAVRHTMMVSSSRHDLTSIIDAVKDDAFGFIVETITRQSLNISDETCDGFQTLVDQDLSEKAYQDYLRKYPALVDPLASIIVDRQYLADKWKTDFVIRRLDNEYIFVEIEKPKDQLFTQYPHPSSVLSHALGQILNWFIWIEDNISYAQSHGFQSIHAPRGTIIIGRRSDLKENHQRMLQALNDVLYPRIVVFTFDDLIVNARNVVTNLTTKSKWEHFI